MQLADLNARLDMNRRHDAQRTAHLLIAIDTLTECWNGVHDTTEFIKALRRTAERLTTLADAVHDPLDKTTANPTVRNRDETS